MISVSDIAVGVAFAILGLAILTWLVVILPDLTRVEPFKGIFDMLFAPAPSKGDVDRAAPPVKFTIERILPLVFWLLILLPMIIFPIILILFPILGLPWSYLLPPVP
ncbi:MAG: hypothetical protein ACYC7D_15655 [Nitrososphaerales archaeon]